MYTLYIHGDILHIDMNAHIHTLAVSHEYSLS